MADRIWRGDAVAVAQVVTVTPGAITAGREYSLSINGKILAVTAEQAPDDAADALCDALAAAVQSSAIPEWREVTASSSGGVLTLTSKQRGMPFTVEALVGGFVQSAAIVFRIRNQPSGGNWNIAFGDLGSVGPAYNVSAATLQGNMDSIFGAGNTLVTKSFLANGDWEYTVAFQGSWANTAVPDVTISYASLTGGNATLEITYPQAAVAGTTCVQTTNHYGSATGGTRTFTVLGLETAAVAYNASTADVQTAVRAKIGNNVNITGTAGTQYIFTFTNSLAHREIPLITVDESLITGGSISASVSISQGSAGINQTYYVDRIAIGGPYTILRSQLTISQTSPGTWSAGSWTLSTSNLSANPGWVTPTIPYDATADEITVLMDAAIGVPGATLVIDTGTSYEIYFYGTRSQEPLAYFSVTSSITGGSVSIGYRGQGDNTQAGFIPSTTFRFYHLGTYSAAVARDASDALWQSTLEAMTFCGVGNVTVTTLNSDTPTFVRSIEFKAALGGQTVVLALADNTDATGQLNIAQRLEGQASGSNETVTLAVAGTPSHGSLVLSQSGQTTEAILYNDTLAEALRKLAALPQIGTANLSATGGPVGSADVVYTFINSLSQQNLPDVTCDDNGLKVVVTMTTPGVTGFNERVKLSLTGQEVWAGTVTLTVDSIALSAIDWNATYIELQAELDAALGSGKALASGGPWPETDLMFEYIGTNAETDMDPVTATDTLKNGIAAAEGFDPLIVAVTTLATGPNYWSDGVNWYNPADPSDHTIPGPLDNVYLTDGNTDILYGLVQRSIFTVDTTNNYVIPATAHDLQDGQRVQAWTSTTLPAGLAAVTDYYVRDVDLVTGKFKLAASAGGPVIDITDAGTGVHQIGSRWNKIVQLANYQGKIGLPWRNDAGYKEYRPLYLCAGLDATGAKLITLGQGVGGGSNRIHIWTATDQVTLEVIMSGGSSEGNAAVLWYGVNTSSIVRLLGGDLGIAVITGEAATFATLEQRAGTIDIGTASFVTWDKTGGQIGSVNAASISGVTMLRG